MRQSVLVRREAVVNRSSTRHPSWFRSASGWAWIGFAGVAALFLLTEHRAHVLGALPFAIFLLCPLLHVFHHRGHGGHGGHGSNDSRGSEEPAGRGTVPHVHDRGGPDQ